MHGNAKAYVHFRPNLPLVVVEKTTAGLQGNLTALGSSASDVPVTSVTDVKLQRLALQ